MSFTIYPAIDLRNGKCVRLTQGDYGQETIYCEDPRQMVEQFIQAGAKWIHMVDLDAARTGEPINLPIIEKLVESSSVPIQVGGGVRNLERLHRLLDLGVSRIVIGSAAIDDPKFVRLALQVAGDKIALGIDARDGMVATHGWLQTSKVTAQDLANEMVQYGAETFIFTDISRDGMLSGVNVEAVRSLAEACGKQVIASGGVRSLEDIRKLAPYQDQGVTGVIIGKALYTHQVQLEEAIQVAREAEAK
ncbi:1-(5-phosphoribosyl)-5-[(5-phosphoribosylamino)methylideneamino]imidazole-4-carboxamide isomerase [Thermoflavimicrobium daqui]|uniref:1-(5-phosphoribosyl)-5-[(5-phosphoribosylamino)methylideneamino] imidazole-4-carboxamide isomerase n=1 Tax=Thermoflavimicrobium daqui TaxID=2137476 RepID=A0A364K547_9BACL|nr:1-(5-phosphoribosyl)-5-[(5-phosphoribosylamino)methylideneamino]imidazole-4-carboxamide isomerase [Thermoflavimicrobium daqui]RAL24500.1 1-(5-phosphoribosyl)-5-[(5-phosphoribosylamino)methylideneamino]imidazole-4-carboxamide isomerase [Thermoflavimicrobium daqui]